jgi:transposase
MDFMGILPQYKGIAVHDGFKSYNKYVCDHALCNAHLQKEPTGIEENYKQQWVKEMNELLTEMKKYSDHDNFRKDPLSFDYRNFSDSTLYPYISQVFTGVE